MIFITNLHYNEDNIYTYNTIHRVLTLQGGYFIVHLQCYILYSKEDTLYTYNVIHVILYYKEDNVYTCNIIHCFLILWEGYCIHIQCYSLLSYITMNILYTPTKFLLLSYITRRKLFTPTILFILILYYRKDTVCTYNSIHCYLT